MLRPSVRPVIRPSVRLSVRPSGHPSVRASVCRSVRPSVSSTVRPVVGSSVCPFFRVNARITQNRESVHKNCLIFVSTSVRRSVHPSIIFGAVCTVSSDCPRRCLTFCRCRQITVCPFVRPIIYVRPPQQATRLYVRQRNRPECSDRPSGQIFTSAFIVVLRVVRPSVRLSVRTSASLFVRLFVRLFVCSPVFASIRSTVSIAVELSVRPSVRRPRDLGRKLARALTAPACIAVLPCLPVVRRDPFIYHCSWVGQLPRLLWLFACCWCGWALLAIGLE